MLSLSIEKPDGLVLKTVSLVVLANKTAAGFISFYSHLSQSIITTFALCLSLQGSSFKKDLTGRRTFCGWLA